jgi:DNA polymerase III delta prime subunit
MKFLETHFDEYIQKYDNISLHPMLKNIYNEFPEGIDNLKNIILYGPSGVGKYTQMLALIKKYSPSDLKYEKKLTCVYNKNNYFFKISDIHFEVDMALLGCNSRLLWNDIYVNICDVLSARINKSGIIVCKNFNKIHSELLDCFYSYIQQNDKNINITYIILSDSISFIPENILNTSHIISVPRPSRAAYNRILNDKISTNIPTNKITNIKTIITNTVSLQNNTDNYINVLYDLICNPENIKFINFRDTIYDIFIYDIEIGYVVYGLLDKLRSDDKFKHLDITYIFIETYSFLKYYNNNYRPIYHLENYLYKIINNIHGF